MIKKKTALKLLRGATVAGALLTTISVGASIIASDWSDFIDTTLGTYHSRIVNSPDADPASLYNYRNEKITSTTDLIKWHKDLAERMAQEGTVLLENKDVGTDKALPLANGAKVTLMGIRSVNPVYGGNIGSSANTTEGVVVDYENALKEAGFKVNKTVLDAYKKVEADFGRDMSFGTVTSVSPKFKSGEPTVADVKKDVAGWDASLNEYRTAVVVIGRPSSEAANFFPGDDGINPEVTDKDGKKSKLQEFDEGANYLGLSKNEKALLDYASNDANFDKVIVIVNSSSAMELGYVQEKADAILWIGDPGTYGLLGLADILKGTVSPSGHLPDTYAVDSTSSPAMVNFGLYTYKNYLALGDEKADQSTYKGFAYLDEAEGIYTGYKYYETRYEDQILGRYNATSATGAKRSTTEWDYDNEVSYTFGYGQSYAKFTQEIVNVKDENGTISVQVKVTNNSDTYAGKDVVQVYVQTPYTEYDRTNHVEKAAIQLAGFEKTVELYPASQANGTDKLNSTEVTVEFDKKYIASYDYVNAKTYILDDGDYYLAVGNGAHEALKNVLALKAETEDNVTLPTNFDGDKGMAYTWHQNEFDKTTYATANGTTVTNQLDDMNLNYWKGDDNSNLYDGQLSRQDWKGTWPKGHTIDPNSKIRTTELELTEDMIKELKNLSYDDIYAAMKDVYGDEAPEWGVIESDLSIGALKGATFGDERWEELLSKITLEEAINFYTNGNSITVALPNIGFAATTLGDGPLGFGTSFRNNKNEKGDPAAVKPDDPNAGYNLQDGALECLLGASFNKELIYEFGERFGTDSLWANQVVVWGVGLNTHRTPYNARNHEYFTEDSMLMNILGAEFTKGAQKYGLIVAVKHFAFNDQETNRTGVSVFMNEQRAREIELRGFEGAFVEGGALGTMTAFNRAGIRYIGAHQGIMTNILRNEWGFNGYNITDMVNGQYYMRADNALLAGTTILDTTNNAVSTSLVQAIKNDPVVQNALRDALHRNLWALANSNAMNGIDKDSWMEYAIPWWESALLSAEVIFGVVTGAAIVGYVVVTLKKKDDDGEVA